MSKSCLDALQLVLMKLIKLMKAHAPNLGPKLDELVRAGTGQYGLKPELRISKVKKKMNPSQIFAQMS